MYTTQRGGLQSSRDKYFPSGDYHPLGSAGMQHAYAYIDLFSITLMGK